MREWLEGRWYSSRRPPWLLLPLAAVYGRIAAGRRAKLSAAAQPLPIPVIVVGNISVGGTGKTPTVIWLVEQLQAAGWRPGVISRGYGGRAAHYPLVVEAETAPTECGDEPKLIQRRCGVPVAVAPARLDAARLLMERYNVDVLVSDDGMQHYALSRQMEICVVDGRRGLGNAALLPAGPLRELPERLRQVQLIIVNGGGWRPPFPVSAPVADMALIMDTAVQLSDKQQKPLADFVDQPLIAMAGIGHPERFFSGLREAGLSLQRTIAMPDHHAYGAADLDFPPGVTVLVTEKDAVKLAAMPQERIVNIWFVPVCAKLAAPAAAAVRQSLPK